MIGFNKFLMKTNEKRVYYTIILWAIVIIIGVILLIVSKFEAYALSIVVFLGNL